MCHRRTPKYDNHQPHGVCTHMKLKMNISTVLIAQSLACLAMAPVALADQALNLAPAASVEIPHSKGKFDFLRIDAKRHRLLAAHENDGTADYIDISTSKVITRLKVGGPVDTAIDPDGKYYYVSVQEPERVAVIDASSLKEVNSIKMPG